MTKYIAFRIRWVSKRASDQEFGISHACSKENVVGVYIFFASLVFALLVDEIPIPEGEYGDRTEARPSGRRDVQEARDQTPHGGVAVHRKAQSRVAVRCSCHPRSVV